MDPTSTESLTRLSYLLAVLRGLHWSHWSSHWRVTGDPQYGDHLLFERLYGVLVEEIDDLGEKIVSYFGPQNPSLDEGMMAEAFKFLRKFKGTADGPTALYEQALAMETELQAILRSTYDSLKAKGEMTLGLDDYLMATANHHESSVYLLRQRLR